MVMMRVLLVLMAFESARSYLVPQHFAGSARLGSVDSQLRQYRSLHSACSRRSCARPRTGTLLGMTEASEMAAETYFSIREKDHDPAHVNSQWVVEVESPDRFLPSTMPSRHCYFMHGTDLVTIKTTDPEESGLGYTIWNSGIALAAIMTDSASAWSENLNGKTVLELGAGPALTGLSIARAFPGAEVHLTDYNPAIVENLLQANNISNVQAWELDWENFLQPGWKLPQNRPDFDIVVAADCVYHHDPAAFTAAVVRLWEGNDSLRFIMMSQADRVGLPLVVKSLKQISDRNVNIKAFTFSQYDTYLNLKKFPVALRRKAKDIPLTCLEIERKLHE